MEIKILEIRDDGTFIPAMAIRLGSNQDKERYLFSKAGYGTYQVEQQKFIFLIKLEKNKCEYNPVAWNDRTMSVAHRELQDNWNRYDSGDVVDVGYILGEREEPRKSERSMK